MIKIKKYCISVLLLSLVSCVSYNATSEKVITTYMDNGNLKYYIRPSKMVATLPADAFVLIDFTYQKKNRDYVSQAFVNFTLHTKTDAFITSARFIIPESEVVVLTDIVTVNRNTAKSYTRVSTIAAQNSVEALLNHLYAGDAILAVELDDGTHYNFTVTEELISRLTEAFQK